MYYVIFEATPYTGKENVAGTYYKSLLPHLHQVSGFHEDEFFFAVNVARQGANIAVFDDLDAISNWRNEEHHLRMQGKGGEVYESYRIRIGRAFQGNETISPYTTRHHLSIFYHDDLGDGKAPDDVTEMVEHSAASQLKDAMLDSTVYQAACTVWVSAWRSAEAAGLFERSIKHKVNGTVVRLLVFRDYTKNSRADAPHEIAGKL